MKCPAVSYGLSYGLSYGAAASKSFVRRAGMSSGKFVNPSEMRLQLSRMLQSRVFERAQRSQRFLCYLVDARLADSPVAVKEYTVAIDVFDRDSAYDPAVDATVRVEASRLRSRLREYYAEE